MKEIKPIKSTSPIEPVIIGDSARIEEILETINSYNPGADISEVQKAYVFAAQAHQGMIRRSGEPYLNHPLAVAKILTEMKLDTASIISGLLHDTVEDSNATVEDVKKLFGEEVSLIVDGVTKISKMTFANPTMAKAENMRKMILAMQTDLRVVLVKLADRLHNMRTLGYMPPHKQKSIACETLEIFAPLAARLGTHKLQVELQDLCLFHLHPEDYDKIRQELAAGRSERNEYINEVIEILNDKIGEFAISINIEGRSKHIYSIWKKMQVQHIPFEQVFDLIAFRIIVDNVQDCYAVLGVIHSCFQQLRGRFKDYISLPKANGYQSLHTSVIGPRGLRMEVQIRTIEMHQYAETGVAAHWRYKAGSTAEEQENKRIMSLRSILSWHQQLENPALYLQTVKETLAEAPNSIYVFTPKGEVRELSADSTPIDFAYNIHSMVGHQCVGAKVNGMMVSLKHKLRNGDIVDILTSKKGKPSRDWLNIVKTSKAKSRIRQWFNAIEKDRATSLGRELLEKELRKKSIPKDLLFKDNVGVQELGYAGIDDLAAAVGFGRLPLIQVIEKLSPEISCSINLPISTSEEASLALSNQQSNQQQTATKNNTGILVSGFDNILVRFACCCSPLPGNDIIGYITQGYGVSIHSANCHSLCSLNSDRFVDVNWDTTDIKTLYPVTIILEANNNSEVFTPLTNLLHGQKIKILEFHLEPNNPIKVSIKVNNDEQLSGIITSIKKIPGITWASKFTA